VQPAPAVHFPQSFGRQGHGGATAVATPGGRGRCANCSGPHASRDCPGPWRLLCRSCAHPAAGKSLEEARHPEAQCPAPVSRAEFVARRDSYKGPKM
jgi:hypothetical protein